MTEAQRYIDSVHGSAHQSAIDIITRLEAERDVLLAGARTPVSEGRLRAEQSGDQLWAALRNLLPDIERLANGGRFDSEDSFRVARMCACAVAARIHLTIADAQGQ